MPGSSDDPNHVRPSPEGLQLQQAQHAPAVANAAALERARAMVRRASGTPGAPLSHQDSTQLPDLSEVEEDEEGFQDIGSPAVPPPVQLASSGSIEARLARGSTGCGSPLDV